MKFRDPASMSKAMTLYLVFETMSKGEISEENVMIIIRAIKRLRVIWSS